MSFRFVVCDDHPLINDSIELFFNRKGHTCLAKLTSTKDLKNFFSTNTAEVLICDLNIDQDNTFEALEIIKMQHPSIFIVIFSAYSDRIFIQKSKDLGINLYISKITELNELYTQIDFLNKEFYTNCQYEMDKTKFIDPKVKFEELPFKISEQEKKIISLILSGATSEGIAKKLFISKFTVDTHRKNINKKLNVSGLIQLQEKVTQYNIL
jgi:DNA-binding NarL/FixJ family response regulator